MPESSVTKRPIAAIYFNEDNGEMAKTLGLRVRSEKVLTRLIWSHLFEGPDNLLNEAATVIIEIDCPKSALIYRSYRSFSHDTEIHWVDSDGQFVSDYDPDKHDKPKANPVVQEKTEEFVDPRAGVNALRAKESDDGKVSAKVETKDVTDAADTKQRETSKDERPSGTTRRTRTKKKSESDSGVRSEEVQEENVGD